MKNDYNPDWVSPPGDTIRDILKEKNIPLYKLAQDLNRSPEQLVNLLLGFSEITIPLANKLSELLGSTPEFWLKREENYRKFITKKNLGKII